jgi:hypothetical protein
VVYRPVTLATPGKLLTMNSESQAPPLPAEEESIITDEHLRNTACLKPYCTLCSVACLLHTARCCHHLPLAIHAYLHDCFNRHTWFFMCHNVLNQFFLMIIPVFHFYRKQRWHKNPWLAIILPCHYLGFKKSNDVHTFHFATKYQNTSLWARWRFAQEYRFPCTFANTRAFPII